MQLLCCPSTTGNVPAIVNCSACQKNPLPKRDEWADIDAATTHANLSALADRKSPLDVLSLADVFFTAFAVGGWLLAAFLPENGEWAAFLDEILDRPESEAAR